MKALLIMAHGSPRAGANGDIERVAQEVRHEGDYDLVQIGYLDVNQPDLPSAIALCVQAGADELVAMPYFLHSGKHLLRDLPDILDAAANEYPSLHISMSNYLGSSPVLANLFMERIAQARAESSE